MDCTSIDSEIIQNNNPCIVKVTITMRNDDWEFDTHRYEALGAGQSIEDAEDQALKRAKKLAKEK